MLRIDVPAPYAIQNTREWWSLREVLGKALRKLLTKLMLHQSKTIQKTDSKADNKK